MTRCLVYNFSGEVEEITHLFPNERLARIAAIARDAGLDVRIVDRANFCDLERFGGDFMANTCRLAFHDMDAAYADQVKAEAKRLLDPAPDLMFMNLWHGSGFKFSMDLLAELKALAPHLRVYGVGQKVDWFTGHILTLADNRLNGLVAGLGYNAVKCLVRGDDPEAIPNMILPGTDGPIATPRETIDVDDYPDPAYDSDVYALIADKVPVFSLTLSNQACPNRCAYCVRPENYGHENRRRKPSRVMEELTHLYHLHGATHFRIEDSTPPPGALTELAREIIASPLNGKIRLSAFSRVDTNRVEDFDTMAGAGILSQFFGLESLDDERLGALHKGFEYAAIHETLTRAHAAGIRTVGSFIFPTPGETETSMQNTLARLKVLSPLLDSAVVLPAGVYPPTEWGMHPERYGIKLADDYIESSVTYPIRYLVPIRHWKPLPFTYDLMGRKAAAVTFQDIVDIQERFVKVVREEYGLPGIPDYYFLTADFLGVPATEAARRIVGHIMQRDYAGLRSACTPS